MNKTTQTVESAGGAFHIEDVYPLVDAGRFPVKRIVGERVEVRADIYRDGHDVISAALVWRRERDREWRRAPMTHHSDDRWGGSFVPDSPGRYVYAIEAWTDEFVTWRHGFELKQKTGADLPLDALEGAGMLTKAQAGGPAASTVILRQCEDFLQSGDAAPLLTDELKIAMAESQFRPDLMRSQFFPFVADRPRARYSGFELLEHEPIAGREEYRDSEIYEIKVRDWDKPGNIKPDTRDLNRARRQNAALQQTANLRFIPVGDENIIAFVKEPVNQTNSVVAAITLSSDVHEFWLPLGDVQVGMADDRRNVAVLENVITGERYPLEWGGIRLQINPMNDPPCCFAVWRKGAP